MKIQSRFLLTILTTVVVCGSLSQTFAQIAVQQSDGQQSNDQIEDSGQTIDATLNADIITPENSQQPESDSLVRERQMREELLDAIESLEVQGGPFNQALIEPLQGLADLLMEQGDYSEALQHYGRLLHINRINQGLYSDNQFAIVDKIIQGNIAVKDWKAANDSQDYKYFVSQRMYADDEAALLNQLNQYIDWKLSYLGLDESRDKSDQLTELKDLAEAAIEIGDEQNANDKVAKASAYYQRAMLHYYFVVAIDQSNETGREIARKKSLSARAISGDSVMSNVDTFPQIKTELSKGKQFMEKANALFTEPEDMQMAAMTTLYLGDWELLTERRTSALEYYQQAYDLLLASGLDKDQVNNLLRQPVAIPVGSPSFTIKDLSDQQTLAEDASIPEKPNAESEKGSDGVQSGISLANYYAWTESLPSLMTPIDLSKIGAAVSEENFLELELDVKVASKRISTPSPHTSSRSFSQRGKGNLSNVTVIDANTSSDKTRWEALDDVDLLMFRPQLVDGKAVETTKARMKYFFAPDQ